MSLSNSIFIAVVTAIVTANISISRFKRERIWEKQAESYSQILFGITEASEYSKAFIKTHFSGQGDESPNFFQTQELKSILAKRKKAENDLKDLSAKHYFFFSKNTRDILDQFHKGVDWEGWMSADDMAEKDLENLERLKSDIEIEAIANIDSSPTNTWRIMKAIARHLDSKLERIRTCLESRVD